MRRSNYVPKDLANGSKRGINKDQRKDKSPATRIIKTLYHWPIVPAQVKPIETETVKEERAC
jgi:hypothetical protein